jgi:hypothetical protein
MYNIRKQNHFCVSVCVVYPWRRNSEHLRVQRQSRSKRWWSTNDILAEGAMTLPVTLSGGVLFAS